VAVGACVSAAGTVIETVLLAAETLPAASTARTV